MQFAKKHAISGLLTGILVTLVGIGPYAHAGSRSSHGECNHNQRSITGSPAELAQRARQLAEHVCENLQAATDCPVTPAVNTAVTALNAMQDGYQLGQGRMNALLTSAHFDQREFAQIQAQQARAIQASAMRYMQFLADAATALTPEQRQMFSRAAHSAK